MAAHLRIADTGQGHNIVTTPQLYGGTYTLFAHMLPSQGVEVRFAETDRVEDLERLLMKIRARSIGNYW